MCEPGQPLPPFQRELSTGRGLPCLQRPPPPGNLPYVPGTGLPVVGPNGPRGECTGPLCRAAVLAVTGGVKISQAGYSP